MSRRKTKGTTSERPILTSVDIGYEYFDTDLNSPIWWDSSNWI